MTMKDRYRGTVYSAFGSLVGYAISEIFDTHPTMTILTTSTLAGLLAAVPDKELSQKTKGAAPRLS